MKASVKIEKGIEELFGTYDANLKLLEQCLQVSTHLNADFLEIEGGELNVARAQRLVVGYVELVDSGVHLDAAELHAFLKILAQDPTVALKGLAEAERTRTLGKKTISPKSLNQRLYVDAIKRHDM